MAAKAKGVGDGDVDIERCGLCRDEEVEVILGVVQVDRGVNYPLLKGFYGDDGFDAAGGAEAMTDHRFG